MGLKRGFQDKMHPLERDRGGRKQRRETNADDLMAPVSLGKAGKD
jgi:hypothetical protein